MRRTRAAGWGMSADPGLALVASVLRRGRNIDLLCSGLTLLATALGLYRVLGGGAAGFAASMAALVLFGLGQKYYALRVALDAELFELLAAADEALPARTRELDQALAELGLANADKAGRAWTERSRGALRLLRLQMALGACQWLLALIYLLLPILHS